MENEGKEFPKHWQSSEELLYYKNRLDIPENDTLRRLLAKGGHDSRVAEHFREEKTIEVCNQGPLLERLNGMDLRLRPIMRQMPT